MFWTLLTMTQLNVRFGFGFKSFNKLFATLYETTFSNNINEISSDTKISALIVEFMAYSLVICFVYFRKSFFFFGNSEKGKMKKKNTKHKR